MRSIINIEKTNSIVEGEGNTSPSIKPKRIPWNKNKKCPYVTEFMKKAYADGTRVSPTKGKSSWNKDIPWSESMRKSIMEGRSKIEYKLSPEHKAALLKANVGSKKSDETKGKISEKAKNRPPMPKERRLKISLKHKGKKLTEEHKTILLKSVKGIPKSIEHRKKISKNLTGRFRGKDSPHWRDGSSFMPYSLEFNNDLKRQIKERDNYTCQLCDKQDFTKNGILHVHHIDYDKLNSNPHNLITLCPSCHSKTNFSREVYSFTLKPLVFPLIGEVCI